MAKNGVVMFFYYLLSAIILGIIVAIPPGSVTIIACQRALLLGFKNSIIFSLGSCLSDLFYITLVYVGISNLIIKNYYFKIILWIICGLLLLIIGILSIISLRKNKEKNKLMNFQSNSLTTFISGILITLTNPMTIIGWIAVGGNYFLVWYTKYPDIRNYMGIIFIFIIIGVMIWFIPLVFIISKLKKIINEKVKVVLVLISNICLIIFGFMSLYYAYTNI